MADHIEVLNEEPEPYPGERSVRPRNDSTDTHSRRNYFGFNWFCRVWSRNSGRPREKTSKNQENGFQNNSRTEGRGDELDGLTNHGTSRKHCSRWRKKRSKSAIENHSELEKHFGLESAHRCNRISWSSFKKSIKRLRSRSQLDHHNELDVLAGFDRRFEASPVLPRSNENRMITKHLDGEKSSSGCLKSLLEKKEEFCIPKMICKVINCSWYWGNIDRFEAALALQTKIDGYFLLRKSAHPDFLFTISFKRFNTTMHVRIESGYDGHDDQSIGDETNKWMDPGRFFPTYSQLVKLIDTCCKPYEGSIYNMPLLVSPLKRTNPLSLKELARAEVYNVYDYSGIESLHIPEELRLYAKEYRFRIRNVNYC